MHNDWKWRVWFSLRQEWTMEKIKNTNHLPPLHSTVGMPGWVVSSLNHLWSLNHLVAIPRLGTRLVSTSSSCCWPSSSSTWSPISSTTSSLLLCPPPASLLTHQLKRRHWCQLFASWRVMQTRTVSWDCNVHEQRKYFFQLKYQRSCESLMSLFLACECHRQT